MTFVIKLFIISVETKTLLHQRKKRKKTKENEKIILYYLPPPRVKKTWGLTECDVLLPSDLKILKIKTIEFKDKPVILQPYFHTDIV